MPNIAVLLKNEIARVARKEVRVETTALKKAASTARAEIAALKRRTQALERQLKALTRASAKAGPPADGEEEGSVLRFSAKGLASKRQRLGLSAQDCGRLLGVSAQTVHNWEEGRVRPRSRHLSAIAAFRRLGKREASAHVQALTK